MLSIVKCNFYFKQCKVNVASQCKVNVASLLKEGKYGIFNFADLVYDIRCHTKGKLQNLSYFVLSKTVFINLKGKITFRYISPDSPSRRRTPNLVIL